MTKIGWMLALWLLAQVGHAQELYDRDAIDKNYPRLLEHPGVKLESAEAINLLYNYKFYEADKEFRLLRLRYPNHPMPTFLMALAEWWKIVPNTDVTDYDDRCEMFLDSTITLGEKLYEDSETKVEASFFLAAAYGFKGRLFAERKKWTKATFAGKNALKYFEKCKGYGNLSPELLFGDGLYNYYATWISQTYPLLRPVLMFFPKGNKEEGIKQMERSANDAFYTRTEARYFLLQIYSMENRHDKAFELAKYMNEQFPDNPFFDRYLAREAFAKGEIGIAETAATRVLARIKAGQAGYEGVSGRTAAYIMAYINDKFYHNVPLAKQYYQQAIDFARQTNALDAGYYWSSVLNLGKIAYTEKDFDLAQTYFNEVMDHADRKSSQYQEAKKVLKEAKQSRREERRKRRE